MRLTRYRLLIAAIVVSGIATTGCADGADPKGTGRAVDGERTAGSRTSGESAASYRQQDSTTAPSRHARTAKRVQRGDPTGRKQGHRDRARTQAGNPQRNTTDAPPSQGRPPTMRKGTAAVTAEPGAPGIGDSGTASD